MQREHGMTLARAAALAEELKELLAPACMRIEIAGSVRRKKAHPNDIEIVLMSNWDEVNDLDRELMRKGVLEKRLDKNGRACWAGAVKRGIFYGETGYAPVDIFRVFEINQWGSIFALRTGPGGFNQKLVTSWKFGGACPLNRRLAGGSMWDLTGHEDEDWLSLSPGAFVNWAVLRDVPRIPTPEEEDFFNAMGVPCWPPEERTEAKLASFITQEL